MARAGRVADRRIPGQPELRGVTHRRVVPGCALGDRPDGQFVSAAWGGGLRCLGLPPAGPQPPEGPRPVPPLRLQLRRITESRH
jgi:hypothetical protein